MTRGILLTLAALAMTGPLLAGSEQAPSRPAGQPAAPPAIALELASVTRNTAGGRGMMGMQPDGRFIATNATLRMLIREAYRIQDFQIIGGPAWISSDAFDVVVKARGEKPAPAVGGVSPVQRMLQAFLEDRFKLKARMETREMPTFELALARVDGKPGPGMTPSTVDCAAVARRGGPPPAPPAPGERLTCGMRMGLGRISGGAVPLPQLAVALSQVVGRPVVDRTGLTASFDVDLTWTPDQFRKDRLPAGAPVPPGVDPTGPTVFMAVQNQLGLKLDFGKGSVPALVIESAEPPVPLP